MSKKHHKKLLKFWKKVFFTKVLSTQLRRAVLKNYKHFAENTESRPQAARSSS